MSEKLWIAGSRFTTPSMVNYAQRAVARAVENNYHIYVGDCYGIDDDVVRECIRIGYSALTVVGAYEKPRIPVPQGKYHRITLPETVLFRPKAAHTRRDEWIAEQVDMGIFIWNGKSSGTKAGYEYLGTLGKTRWLVEFT